MDDSGQHEREEGERRPVSALLRRLCERDDGRICLGDIVEDDETRGLSILVFVLASPNVIPVLPPGVVTGTGLILTPLTALMLVKGDRASLPDWLRRRGVERSKFCQGAKRLLPRLEKIEGATKRRLPFLFGPVALRLTAAVSLLMSALILAPIPFANLIPGMALALMALSLIEHDGVCLLAGYGLAVVSLGLAYALWMAGGAGFHALGGLFHH